jgi:hypothetical protein
MFCVIYLEDFIFILLYSRIGGKIGMFLCDPEWIMVIYTGLFGTLESRFSCYKSNLKSYALFDLSWFALLSERQLEDIGRINVLWMETKTFHARKQPFWWMENYFLGWSHPSICHPLTSPLRWGYQNRNNWNKSLSVMRPQELSLKERERTRE